MLDKEVQIEVPLFSAEQILEFEEKLKKSFYLKEVLEITYLEDNQLKKIKEYVIKLDGVYKNIYFQTKRINFRQIIDIK